MSATSTTLAEKKQGALPAILWGGLAAGILDITAAYLRWGFRGVGLTRILQSIASGLLGLESYNGGIRTAILGAALHFFIALSAATVYYVASRKLTFLKQNAVLWGVLYGIAVYFFMARIVVPLSAVPQRKAPEAIASILIGVVTHIVCVGLPISLSVRRYSR